MDWRPSMCGDDCHFIKLLIVNLSTALLSDIQPWRVLTKSYFSGLFFFSQQSLPRDELQWCFCFSVLHGLFECFWSCNVLFIPSSSTCGQLLLLSVHFSQSFNWARVRGSPWVNFGTNLRENFLWLSSLQTCFFFFSIQSSRCLFVIWMIVDNKLSRRVWTENVWLSVIYFLFF